MLLIDFKNAFLMSGARVIQIRVFWTLCVGGRGFFCPGGRGGVKKLKK